MKRGSFSHKDAMQGGFGFKEGILVIDKSVVAVHQFPMNSQTKEQSDPFVCMRWTGTKLDKELNVIEGEEPVVIPLRMCKVESGQPGMLKEKDWDDTDVLPKPLGTDVDTEGNALLLEDDARVEGSGWAKMEDSLVKAGFKESIAARGIANDYVGLIAHFTTVEGDKYIAKRGKNAGKEVTASNLVCDRIYKRPYEKDSKVKVGGEVAGTTSKSNGKDTDETGDEKVVKAVATALENASPKFKAEFYTGKPIDRKKFNNGLVKELMKQDVDDKLQGEIMQLVKSLAGLKQVAGEVGFKANEESVTFAEE